jgi:glycerophosphoryl diester phosphodiesterase
MVAHRGVSGVERENTCAAFVFAGSRSYYGIETDVHVTADGQYCICHDDDLKRVAGVDIKIEESTYAEISAVRLTDTDGTFRRSDLVAPLLQDYIAICRKYNKVAVLELKNPMGKEHIAKIVAIVKDMGWLNKTTFISFTTENVVNLREMGDEYDIQYLTADISDANIEFMKKYKMDADVYYIYLTKDFVERAHKAGIKVNCWTVDDPKEAATMLSYGVDFMTTNILE